MHWHEILFLGFDYRPTTPPKGRVSVACSSFVVRLKDQLSFRAQISIKIVTCIPCSRSVFSDILEGVVLQNFSGGRRPDPIILPLLFHNSPVLCNAIVGLRAFIFRGARSYRQISEFISVANYTYDEYNLVSTK